MTTTLLLSSLAFNLAAAGLVGLSVGSAFLPPRRRGLRSESQLVEVLGVPLLAARPLAPQALAQQLLAHWFRPGRVVLPVVSAERGTGGTRATAELARALAALGARTLLIDADFRSPAVHAEFGLPNRAGLIDFLEGRGAALAHCSENLSVLVAGRAGADPLDLLSRPRMQALLGRAAQRYSVVLVDTPPSASGPDLQLFAAFGGGALVVTRQPASPDKLERLRQLLAACRAQVVGTVIARNPSPA
jgi:Mrp family chromosome partitioning ATPase